MHNHGYQPLLLFDLPPFQFGSKFCPPTPRLLVYSPRPATKICHACDLWTAEMVISFPFFFFLHHAVSLDQPKRISRPIYCRVEIPEKISIDPPNLENDHEITYLKV